MQPYAYDKAPNDLPSRHGGDAAVWVTRPLSPLINSFVRTLSSYHSIDVVKIHNYGT